MKPIYMMTFAAIMISATSLMAQKPAAPVKPGADTIANEKILRDGKASLEAKAAALDKLLAAPDAPSIMKFNACMTMANALGGKNKLAEATAVFGKIATLDGVTPGQKLQAINANAKMHFARNFSGGFASYSDDGINKAHDIYLTALQIKDLPKKDLVEQYQLLANCKLETFDEKAANEYLDAAIKIPGLTEKELFRAKRNKAISLMRQHNYDAALPVLKEIRTDDLAVNDRNEIDSNIVRILVTQKKADEAKKMMKEWKASDQVQANIASSSESKAQELERKVKSCLVVLDDPKDVKPNVRQNALSELFKLYGGEKDTAAIMSMADKYMPILIKQDPKAEGLYLRLLGWPFVRMNLQQDMTYAAWLAAKVEAVKGVSDADLQKALDPLFIRAIQTKNESVAKVTLGKLQKLGKLKQADSLRYQLASIIMESKGKSSADLGKKIDEVLVAGGVKQNDYKGKADALLNMAKSAMGLEMYELAKTLYAERQKMLVPDTRRSINCTFIPDGPSSIAEFMASDYFKDKKNRGVLDRKYGDNLQFLLETDASTVGRTVTEKAKDFVPTEFVTTCNEDGVFFFFYATLSKDRAKAIKEKFSGMGGYEIYLGTSGDDPYRCYLVEQDFTSEFVTQYDNLQYRNTRKDLKSDVRYYDNGVALLLFMPWKSFFYSLPKEGDKWEFEPLHWEHGGYSWGGSKSVHNRSSFGDVVFKNMTAKNLNSIKRRLIPQALNVYRLERSANNGYMEIWQDPDLGDRKFYLERVKPLEEELNSYIEKVKPNMSDEDVELVFEKAVPRWMNIKYILSKMRKDYLDEQRVAGK